MNPRRLAAVAFVSSVALCACGDDASTDGTGGGSAQSSTGATSTSPTTAPGSTSDGSTSSDDASTSQGPGSGGGSAESSTASGGPVCGDTLCDAEEDCSSCAEDCGACGPQVCGDGACTGSEACGDCPSDCGLCPIEDQPGQRVCIGEGSGFLDHPDAGAELGLAGGDVLCINPGTYDGMDLGGLTAADGSRIVVVNDGAVEFTGGVHFHDLANVEIRGDGDPGVDFGFHVRDTGYRGVTIDGAVRRVTWSHWALTNIPDYGFRVYNPDLSWDGTDATTLYGMKFFDIRARDQGAELFIFGNFQPLAERTSIVQDLEIARVDLETLQSCTAINADLVIEAKIHHNRLIDTGLSDTRHCGIVFLHGNGAVHHNVIENFWGNALRAWCIGTPGSQNVDFYDNVVVGSRKYSGVEAQSFDEDMAVSPATTCAFRYVNNTFGNLTALDYEAAMVDAYYIAGSTLEVGNNLGFNIALDQPYDPEKNYAVHYVGVDSNAVTEGVNLYGRTAQEIGLVDEAECQLAPGSPAIDAGATIDWVTNDLSGIARPQGAAYDLGAREHL